jgi:hypothetical protein
MQGEDVVIDEPQARNAHHGDAGDDATIPTARPGQSLPVFRPQSGDSDSMSVFLDSFAQLLQGLGPQTGHSKACAPVGQSSAAKVQAPKNYMVNQNFRIWLERFDTYAQLARIPEGERKQQLLSRLDHQAYVAVANLHLPSTLTYSEFTSALIRRFHNTTREDFKLQLRARVQNSSESYEAFADNLQELALNAYPDSGFSLQQEMALDQFLVGVGVADTLKQQLLMSSPKFLEEAIRKVRQLESAQLLLRQSSHPVSHHNTPKPKVAKVMVENQTVVAASATSSQPTELSRVLSLLEKMESRISQLEKSKSEDAGTKQCWRCHGDGHGPSRCPTLECYHCHEYGHMSRFCPKKSGNEQKGLSRGGQSQ